MYYITHGKHLPSVCGAVNGQYIGSYGLLFLILHLLATGMFSLKFKCQGSDNQSFISVVVVEQFRSGWRTEGRFAVSVDGGPWDTHLALHGEQRDQTAGSQI